MKPSFDWWAYDARSVGFGYYAVFAVYLDESGSRTRGRRIGYAACLGTVDQWDRFSIGWLRVLMDQAVVGNLEPDAHYDFHAKNGGYSLVQRRLNRLLPTWMLQCGIFSSAVAMNEADYIELSTHADRSRLGNVYGFAGFGAAVMMGSALRSLGGGYAGYYVDRGGPGFDKVMQLFGDVYNGEQHLRPHFRLAHYGPANRHDNLPIHAADLVAHEVVTRGQASPIVQWLGNELHVHELTPIDIASLLGTFREMDSHHKWKRSVRRNKEKSERRSQRKG